MTRARVPISSRPRSARRRRVSSAAMTSASASTRRTRGEASSTSPIGVPTSRIGAMSPDENVSTPPVCQAPGPAAAPRIGRVSQHEDDAAVPEDDSGQVLTEAAPEPGGEERRPTVNERIASRLRAPDPPVATTEDDTRATLSARLLRPIHETAWTSWAITAAVTILAAVLRLVELGRPARLVFDETYYVKQAFSLLTIGYEGRWSEDPNLAFAGGDFSDLGTDA